MSDWKQKHAHDAERALQHDIVRDVIKEQLLNLNAEHDAMVKYLLTKIASYAAQVARAQALGFDPDLLRMTDAEANASMLAIAKRAVELGTPVIIVEGGGE